MSRSCAWCGESLEQMRSDAKYCGDAHKMAAYRKRRAVTATSPRTDRASTPAPAQAESPSEPYVAVTEPLPGELTEDELVERIKETFDAVEFDEVWEAEAG